MREPFRDTAFVMDSGSLLAYLRGETGGAIVQRVFRQCSDCETQVEIAANNLLEAYSIAAAEASPSLEELAALIDQLPLRVEPFTVDSAVSSAQVIFEHPQLDPLQASALSLAQEKGATLITADSALASLSPSLYIGERPREGDHAQAQEFQSNSPDVRR